MYRFADGVNARFTNCQLDNNYISADGSELALVDAMFDIDGGAEVLFEDCQFANNSQDGRRLFSVGGNGSILTVTNTVFDGNEDAIGDTELFYIAADAELLLYGSTFTTNRGYARLIYADAGTARINSSTFSQNTVSTIISADFEPWNNAAFECVASSNADIIIVNSSFSANTVDRILQGHGADVYASDLSMSVNACVDGRYLHTIDASMTVDDTTYHANSDEQASNNVSLCFAKTDHLASVASQTLFENVSKSTPR